MQRRKFIEQAALAGAALTVANSAAAQTAAGTTQPQQQTFPVVRYATGRRKFKSVAVESTIDQVKQNIKNKELAWMFENCFPNTLDTTVDYTTIDGKPDTYVITGDIDAMWLRDSSAQVWPYIPLTKNDKELKRLIEGVIRRQNKFIILDPYANAFFKDPKKVSEWKETDITDMKPGVHERKWEVDSLCYPIRLAYAYWKTTGDTAPFDSLWKDAMVAVVKTFKEQQRFQGAGPYKFQRKTFWATDGVPIGGYGYPVKPNGLICSIFRPSDDATIYPYLIPSNFFAASELVHLAEMWEAIFKDAEKAKEARDLSRDVFTALRNYATIVHPQFGKMYAYEINGYGSYNLMDDGNVPSLLAMPYLGSVFQSDLVYQNTRKYVLSEENPFFFKGKAAEGVGSPHTLMNKIWPMAIIMRGMTSSDPKEIASCLEMLRTTHAGTGFMHESFDKDAPIDFTRKWFAWANTLFGEFILKVYKENKALLDYVKPAAVSPSASPVKRKGIFNF
ncbi:glycoside hydrolase family 125 protein [Haoranjiania flava]|uniref:Glycoside hydrolase family 125 protein n=1 Tax=Haoranjiania flava TaxID=1856322 RepID=A0AAE3IPX7_9BACT|nr:glycoside hydrolase family 125 protein [Haoranjiania flava]MCU7694276.1 glycoside hydrolase family 125 protein [Haoranjiania flava]